VPVMAQKSLIGHSKGGSASWQMMGLLQTVGTGIVPGNRNSDNIDAMFQKHRYLMFPSKSIHTDGIRAGVMSSFGFGQVGGTALVLNPRYLFGALEPSAYAAYQNKIAVRAHQAYKAMSEMMITNSLVKIKDAPPYTPELEVPVLMNSMARAILDTKTGSYSFPAKLAREAPSDKSNTKAVADIISDIGSVSGVGVDQELISAVPSHNPTFVFRNFTSSEIAYCNSQPSPEASFAARWVGKEAVFKSLNVPSKGAAAAMQDIEILPNEETGAPEVILHGDAKKAAEDMSIGKILISLSHSETVAIAFAQAQTTS